jgi:hypothetical protein
MARAESWDHSLWEKVALELAVHSTSYRQEVV